MGDGRADGERAAKSAGGQGPDLRPALRIRSDMELAYRIGLRGVEIEDVRRGAVGKGQRVAGDTRRRPAAETLQIDIVIRVETVDLSSTRSPEGNFHNLGRINRSRGVICRDRSV